MRRSELGRQIAVDLESDANLDEGRGGPNHGVSLSTACCRRLLDKISASLKRRKGVAGCPDRGGRGPARHCRGHHGNVIGYCSLNRGRQGGGGPGDKPE